MSNHYPPAIRIANYGDAKFTGWVKTTTDRWSSEEAPPKFLLRAHEAQAFDDADPETRTPRFTLIVATGRRFGSGRTEIGVWTSVLAGQMIVQHWGNLVPASDAAAACLESIGAHSLHWRTLDEWQQWLAELGIQLDTLRYNGAFIEGHMQQWNPQVGARRELWVRFDPHTPELLFCETLVVAAGKRAHVQAAPEFEGWRRVAMRGPEGLVHLADGQGVATAFTLVNLPFHANLAAKGKMDLLHSNRVLAAGQVVAHATTRLYPSVGAGPGWPKELSQEECIAWTNQHLVSEQEAIEQMHTAGKLGPAQDMARKGKQEDQFFLGSEARLPGCEIPREMAAWGFARFPCQILNLHGQPIDPRLHDKLVFWMGRPHYNRNVSPDQLGRTSGWPNATECQGWTNPCDEEHWLINNLWVATMLRNSPVHQRLLEFQARAWLLSCTTDPRLATTRPGAARAVGYKCWVAWLLWQGLQDRALADQVVSHASKWLDVIVPMIRQRTQDGWWDVRVNVPALGSGRWVMPWQQALGAYGLWRLGALVGHQEAINIGYAGALVVVNSAYWLVEGRWRALYSMCLDDNRRDDKDDYSDFGCPLALPVVGAQRPDSPHHEKWRQLVKYGSGRWTCPMTDQQVV